MTTKAQKEAAKRWTERNRDKQRIYQNRSAARRFIREMATLEDLEELKGLISTRERELLIVPHFRGGDPEDTVKKSNGQ